MLKKNLARWLVNTIFLLGLPTVLFSSTEIGQKELKNLVKTSSLSLPLYFEKNEGQAEKNVKYFSFQRDCALYFTPQEVVMFLPNKASLLKIQFIDANKTPLIGGIELQDYKTNYFIGNDPEKWLTNMSNYAKICYKDLYPGIDLIFYGNQGELEYDICIAPGSNPKNAHLHIEGAESLSIDEEGNLQIYVEGDQKVAMQKPFLYQVSNGNHVSVEGKFILLAQNEIGFEVGIYDKNKTLIIDPILVYSSYLGGSEYDRGMGIATDGNGNVFVAGTASSPNFPITPGAYQTDLIGVGNAFITKLNIFESKLIYSTYLGSSSVRGENLSGLAIDGSGNAYVVGSTDSDTFPITQGAYQTILKGLTNCFITKLDPTGSNLVYSTLLGGSALARGDQSGGIAVDKEGNAFVNGTTMSIDFPVTRGAYQTNITTGNQNSFITKLNAAGSGIIYSTFLGGTTPGGAEDRGYGITIDDNGNAYVTGSCESTDFPTSLGAYQTFLAGSTNCYVSKLNASGSQLLFSTYLGGSQYDYGISVAIDSAENVYVGGTTLSSNFPTTIGAFQRTFIGASNCFVTKFNHDGTDLLYSTLIGGSGTYGDGVNSICVGSKGNAYITGQTDSSDFPTTPDAYQGSLPGLINAFITEVNPSGTSLVYSSYLGGADIEVGNGITLDSNENIYITGFTTSINYPVTANAYQDFLAGTDNCFITIFGAKPQQPSSFQGKKIKNAFPTQTDYVNHLTWAPSSNSDVIAYKLFRNESLIATIPSNAPCFYYDHNRLKNQKYTYTLIAVSRFNLESAPSTTSL